MPSLIYDVAASIDGYIAGRKGDISGFPMEGPHVAGLYGPPCELHGREHGQ